MSKLLREAMIEIPSVDFGGMNDGQASSACELWVSWAKANASFFSPHEWTAIVHALCDLRNRYANKYVY